MHKHYSLLGLESGADKESIKTAFRRLAMVFHPDRDLASKQRFAEICQAYKVLMNHNEANVPFGLVNSYNIKNLKSARAIETSESRRFGKRGNPGDRRFESVLETEYKGTRIRVEA